MRIAGISCHCSRGRWFIPALSPGIAASAWLSPSVPIKDTGGHSARAWRRHSSASRFPSSSHECGSAGNTPRRLVHRSCRPTVQFSGKRIPRIAEVNRRPPEDSSVSRLRWCSGCSGRLPQSIPAPECTRRRSGRPPPASMRDSMLVPRQDVEKRGSLERLTHARRRPDGGRICNETTRDDERYLLTAEMAAVARCRPRSAGRKMVRIRA